MQRTSNMFKSLDWVTVAIYFVMIIAGWFTIYAARFDYDHAYVFDFSVRHGMQILWILFALILALSILLIDSKFYSRIAYVFYGAMLLLLVLTIFISPDIKGSHSWIKIGSFSIQPAEFAKYATALCLAKFMSSFRFDLRRPRNYITVAAIIAVPAMIIIAQSETGSALVFSSFLLVLFREGMDGMFLLVGSVAVLFFILVLRYNNLPVDEGVVVNEKYGYIIVFLLAIAIVAALVYYYTRDKGVIKVYAITNGVILLVGATVHFFFPEIVTYTIISLVCIVASIIVLVIMSFVRWRMTFAMLACLLVASVGLAFSVNYAFDQILEPHQQIRIKIVLGLADDPQGAGYNVNQSQIAIGSGGLIGKGFLNGTQTKLDYVPEQDTDFIFCTIGEEMGFLGTFGFIALYVFLLIRLVFLAERQRSPFSRVYGYSVASIFFFHFTINIGMVIGLLPVIGIPLPFFSYGGSSMWGFTILLFTFLRLDANRMEVLQQ